MKVSIKPVGRLNGPVASSVARKLSPKAIVDVHWPPQRAGAFVRRIGRLIDLKTKLDVAVTGKCDVVVQLAESEIFFLAALCRRGRSDDELLAAIFVAERGEPEGRKQHRRRENF